MRRVARPIGSTLKPKCCGRSGGTKHGDVPLPERHSTPRRSYLRPHRSVKPIPAADSRFGPMSRFTPRPPPAKGPLPANDPCAGRRLQRRSEGRRILLGCTHSTHLHLHSATPSGRVGPSSAPFDQLCLQLYPAWAMAGCGWPQDEQVGRSRVSWWLSYTCWINLASAGVAGRRSYSPDRVTQ